MAKLGLSPAAISRSTVQYFQSSAAAVFAASFLAFGSVRAAEQSAESRNAESLRCAVVMGQLIAMDDEQARQAGQMGALYFKGRMDGALSDAEIEHGLFVAAQAMRGVPLANELRRCQSIIGARNAAHKEIVSRLSARLEASEAGKK